MISINFTRHSFAESEFLGVRFHPAIPGAALPPAVSVMGPRWAAIVSFTHPRRLAAAIALALALGSMLLLGGCASVPPMPEDGVIELRMNDATTKACEEEGGCRAFSRARIEQLIRDAIEYGRRTAKGWI